jgi:hypothetical protein
MPSAAECRLVEVPAMIRKPYFTATSPRFPARRGRADRAEISTVRSYVEALGGQIEIVAKFGDERIAVG